MNEYQRLEKTKRFLTREGLLRLIDYKDGIIKDRTELLNKAMSKPGVAPPEDQINTRKHAPKVVKKKKVSA